MADGTRQNGQDLQSMPPREFRQGPTPFTADGLQGSLYPGAVKDFVACTTVDTVYLLQKTSVIIFAASHASQNKEATMKAVVGVFRSRSDAEEGAAALVPLEIPASRINVLTPEMTDKEIAAVPTMASEQPGMGEAMGAVVGGAMGVAGGAGFAPAVASLLIPGVGPVLGIGILAGILLGAIGAVGGGAVGAALEGATSEGVPENELFIYEDALQKGCSVVVVMAEDDHANAVRGALELAGAETVDRAREMWWLGLRDAEKERYSADGSIFEHDERDFRSGFEAALRLRNRNRSYEQCYQELDVDARDNAAFRRGYERGRQYLERFRKHASA